MSQHMVLTEENLYEILSFLVSSAHLCVKEPRFYGTFRLIDAACRLVEFSLESELLKEDQFLHKFKAYADENKLLLMTDEGAYFEFLEDATRQMAKEMKRRATARGNSS